MEEERVKKYQKMHKEMYGSEISFEEAIYQIQEAEIVEYLEQIMCHSDCDFEIEMDDDKVIIIHFSDEDQEGDLLKQMSDKDGEINPEVLFNSALYFEYYKSAMDVKSELENIGFYVHPGEDNRVAEFNEHYVIATEVLLRHIEENG